MKIGIIGAMEEETRLLKEALQERTSVLRAGVVFYEGIIDAHEVVLVQSGIGKVQAAMVATLLIQQFGVVAVLNTGSAGAVATKLSIGDVVVANETAYFDVDVTSFGYEMGQLPQQPARFVASNYLLATMKETGKKAGQPLYEGLILTGDSFVNSPLKTAELARNFEGVLACEMEGAAIAQVCHQFGVGFLVVRSMSDTADHQATMNFDAFILEAGERSARLVLAFLRVLQ